MKKIPTMFERDWNGDRTRVVNQVHAGCEWVLNGEGVATRKLDGTCCMIRDGKLFKRQEFKKNITTDFEEVEYDPETGKHIGWLPVGDGPEDKWHRAGFNNLANKTDGTYELIGPHIQGNPEGENQDILIPHDVSILELDDVPRDFNSLKTYLSDKNIEGIVFHHPDGRRAKIKKRDFGLKRK